MGTLGWLVGTALAQSAPEARPEAPLAGDEVRSDALVALVAVVADDRVDPAVRSAAAERLAELRDPRAPRLVLAVADGASPELGRALAEVALAAAGPDADELLRRVIRIRRQDRATVDRLLVALGNRGADSAADTLWALAGDAALSERQRSRAQRVLRERYPGPAARLGPPPVVADALGGSLLVAAGGTAGGVVLSGIGRFGGSDSAEAIGAVGGAVLGSATGVLRLTNRPATAGEGLAVATGVGWGVGLGALATTAQYGRWGVVPFSRRSAAEDGGGGWRAVGTLVGATSGYGLSLARPSVQNGLEVNLAGTLGTLFGTGVAQLALDPDAPTSGRTTPGRPTAPSVVGTGTFSTSTTFGGTVDNPFGARGQQSRRVGAGALAGALAGLGVGVGVASRWEPDLDDLAFGGVVGAEAAWLGVSIAQLGGPVRRGALVAPGAAGTALGLVGAELLPSSVGRTLATAYGVGVGNALGASLPLVRGYDDDRAIAGFSIPGGLVGATAAWLAEPWLAPTPGDAAMIGVTTVVAGGTGMLVGRGLSAAGAWPDGSQGTGLGLLVGGVAGVGSWALVPIVDARADRALFVGTGAVFGGLYGALAPYAAGADAETSLFVSAGTVAGFTALSALVVSDAVGFDPGDAVVPEAGAATGATLGALGAALLATREGGEPPPTSDFTTGTFRSTPATGTTGGTEEDDATRTIAAGTLVGGTVGLAAGIVVEAVFHPMASAAVPRLRAREVVAVPTFSQEPGPAGPRTLVGLSVSGW